MSRALAPWALVVAGLAAASAAVLPVAALALAAATGVVVWRWPAAVLEAMVFTILALRPSLDIFSERRYGLSEFAPNPAVVFGVVVLCVAAVEALVRARAGRSLWPSRSLRTSHLWLAAACGSAFLSGARLYGAGGAGTGLRDLIRVASIVAAFLMVLWWVENDPRRFWRGWSYVALGLVVPVGVATWQWVSGTGDLEVEGLNRLRGTFSHPNSFGAFVVPPILVALAGGRVTRGLRRLGYLAILIGLTVLLVRTYSRTALLVLVTGLAVLPLVESRRFGWVGLARTFAVVLAAAAIVWWVGGDLIRARFEDITVSRIAWEAALVGGSENSLTWRLINWAGLIGLGLEHPLTGHGLGMTMVLNPLGSGANGVPFNAHNDFVRWFFEGGLVGLGCYLAYGFLLCRWALARARLGSADRSTIAYAVAAAWLAMFFLTAGVPELSLQTAVQYELYGMAGLLMAPRGDAPDSSIRAAARPLAAGIVT